MSCAVEARTRAKQARLNAPTRYCPRCGQTKQNWRTTYAYCPPCLRAYQKQWRDKNPDKTRGYQQRSKYGQGAAEEIARLVVRQRGLCAGCEKPLPAGKRQHTDHDHRTGEIRGVLCSNCNMILGLAHDDPVRLQSLAHYLIRAM